MVRSARPQCVVIAGPNGAGKSSSAPELLKDTVGVSAFVNADVIAQGLAAFQPETVAIDAGRIMLARIGELAEAREDFAFETTLSGKTIGQLLKHVVERLILVGDVNWRVYDGSEIGPPGLVAHGGGGTPLMVLDAARWAEVFRGMERAQ